MDTEDTEFGRLIRMFCAVQESAFKYKEQRHKIFLLPEHFNLNFSFVEILVEIICANQVSVFANEIL